MGRARAGDEGVVAGEFEVLQARQAREMHEQRRAVLVHVREVEMLEAARQVAVTRR